jgi:hypothetical protein
VWWNLTILAKKFGNKPAKTGFFGPEGDNYPGFGEDFRKHLGRAKFGLCQRRRCSSENSVREALDTFSAQDVHF